ncbi:MAG: hypothetical protein AB8G99_07870 [Planctomycetaceae bacterium]
MSTKWLIRICAVVVAGSTLCPASQADDSYTLSEEAGETAFQVNSKVTITGNVLTPVAEGAAKEWPLKSQADYSFKERRLVSGGRDARSLRAVRRYANAISSTSVGDHKTKAKLDPASLVVAEGRDSGVLFYSPGKPLTRDVLDLLSSPGDTLSAIAMLPTTEVEIGDKWNPDQWVMQMLTDVEAAVKSRLTCELVSVARRQAKIKITGHVEGAALGSACLIDLEGHMVFDLTANYVKEFELKRTEERTAGTVSPGLKVEALVKWDRKRSDAVLPDDRQIPVEPDAKSLELTYRSPWGVELRHDRDWHVFNETDRVAVLRLVRQGSLVAQCNIAQIGAVKPGTNTSEKQFQQDIRETLGEQLTDLSKGTVLSKRPRFLFRTVASGKSGETEMDWVYYLCAGPSGEQVSLVFSVAASDSEKVLETHTALAKSIQFPATRVTRKKKRVK